MNKQLNEKIKIIEQSIQNTKVSLKTWANQIGKYHTQLKTLTQQLDTLKEQIIMNEQNNNKPKTQGGKK